MADYYAVLTLSPRARLSEIKTRYRKLSLSYHPDTGGSMEKMMQLNEAYRILSNPLLRREYDQKHINSSRPTATTHASSYAHTSYAQPAARSTEQSVHHQTATQYYQRRTRRQPAKKSHFGTWFVVATIVVLAFLGYQIYTTVQPAPVTTSTPTTTTPTTTFPTATGPITSITQDTTTQPTTEDTVGAPTTDRHRSFHNEN